MQMNIERHFVEMDSEMKISRLAAHSINMNCRCNPIFRKIEGRDADEFIWIHQSFAEKAVTADEAGHQKGDR